MLQRDNWIELAAFINEHKHSPEFVASMRPIALVDHPGPRGGKPKTRAVVGRFLDQACALTGILPLHLHAWNGRETEVAEFLKREKPFGETTIHEWHPRSDNPIGKQIVQGESAEKDINVQMRNEAIAAINAIAGF